MTPKAGSGQHCLRLALHLGGNYAVADLASAEKLYCFVISVNCPPLREISMVPPIMPLVPLPVRMSAASMLHTLYYLGHGMLH